MKKTLAVAAVVGVVALGGIAMAMSGTPKKKASTVPTFESLQTKANKVLYTETKPAALLAVAKELRDWANADVFSGEEADALDTFAQALEDRAAALGASASVPAQQRPAQQPAGQASGPVVFVPESDTGTELPSDDEAPVLGGEEHSMPAQQQPAAQPAAQQQPAQQPAQQPVTVQGPELPDMSVITALGARLGSDPNLANAALRAMQNKATAADIAALVAVAAELGITSDQLDLILDLDPTKVPSWAWLLTLAQPAQQQPAQQQPAQQPAAQQPAPAASSPAVPPETVPASEPVPTHGEVAAVDVVPEDTAIVADILLTAEGKPNWKRKEPALGPWQKKRGLKDDNMFGPKSALAMAKEIGTVPIVRFWPSASQKTTAVPEYQGALYELANREQPERAGKLRASAAREVGQAYERNPKPVSPLFVLETA
jgi:hypothetical protein